MFRFLLLVGKGPIKSIPQIVKGQGLEGAMVVVAKGWTFDIGHMYWWILLHPSSTWVENNLLVGPIGEHSSWLPHLPECISISSLPYILSLTHFMLSEVADLLNNSPLIRRYWTTLILNLLQSLTPSSFLVCRYFLIESIQLSVSSKSLCIDLSSSMFNWPSWRVGCFLSRLDKVILIFRILFNFKYTNLLISFFILSKYFFCDSSLNNPH